MAQIIKHRRGSIAGLKGTTARNAELIVASGSISDLSGPFVFIGSPNSGDEGVAGASATKMRNAASSGDEKTFHSMAPTSMSKPHKHEMYKDVRRGLGIQESISFKQFLDI